MGLRLPAMGSPVLAAWLLAIGLASTAARADLTSASYSQRGGNVPAAASALSSPSFSGSGALAGQPLGASGVAQMTGNLETLEPGFFPIVRGRPATLDLDADGIAWFLDDDDDGDGIEDVFETNTGVFVDTMDTGTDALVFDTDDDGFDDGFEVGFGSDPNLASSTPGGPGLPALGFLARALVGFGLCAAAAWTLRRHGFEPPGWSGPTSPSTRGAR